MLRRCVLCVLLMLLGVACFGCQTFPESFFGDKHVQYNETFHRSYDAMVARERDAQRVPIDSGFK